MIEYTNIEIVTPLDVLISKEVKMAVLPGLEGDLGVMPKHTPLMSLLKRGVLKLYNKDSDIIEQIILDGGVVEVKEDTIQVLSERAEFLNQSNKTVIEEKLIDSKKQINNEDKAISNIAKKENEFLNYVLEQMN